MSAAEIMSNVYETMGKGGFNSDDALELSKEYFAPDCILDNESTIDYKNVDFNKVYIGPVGWLEWCRRLANYGAVVSGFLR